MQSITFSADILSGLFALCSIILSFYVYRNQKKFNELSLKPYCYIDSSCYTDKLWIYIINKWKGPMKITSSKVTSSKVTNIKKWKHPLDFFNEIDDKKINWNDHRRDLNNFILSDNEEPCVLIEISGKNLWKNYNKIKEIFWDLEITIEYEDIFWNKQPPCITRLNWFKDIN